MLPKVRLACWIGMFTRFVASWPRSKSHGSHSGQVYVSVSHASGPAVFMVLRVLLKYNHLRDGLHCVQIIPLHVSWSILEQFVSQLVRPPSTVEQHRLPMDHPDLVHPVKPVLKAELF